MVLSHFFLLLGCCVPIIEVELSDFYVESDEKKEKSIDYGVIETLIPLAYGLSFATFSNDYQLFVPISVVLIYSKFYDFISNTQRTIVLCIV